MSSFARRDLLWLAPVAVKAQDELAALGPDGSRTQPKIARYPGKGKHLYELDQSQLLLTPTGLLMEGQCAFRRPTPVETHVADSSIAEV